MMISIKSEKEIQSMRKGGKILAEIIEKLETSVLPGENTLNIDKLAEKLVFASGGKPAFKGYGKEAGNPFPATICSSINDEIVHGIPSKDRILKDGDLLKIDIGMEFEGMMVDMARTFPVGRISPEAKKIKEITEQSFWEGVGRIKAGKFLSDYSKTVQKFVEKNGFSVVKNLVGHGIGKDLHEDPYIPNFYNRKYNDLMLEAGMTFALEPMVNGGTFETILGPDGWVFKTKDGKLSAHYENTILIMDDGFEILTTK